MISEFFRQNLDYYASKKNNNNITNFRKNRILRKIKLATYKDIFDNTQATEDLKANKNNPIIETTGITNPTMNSMNINVFPKSDAKKFFPSPDQNSTVIDDSDKQIELPEGEDGSNFVDYIDGSQSKYRITQTTDDGEMFNPGNKYYGIQDGNGGLNRDWVIDNKA